MLRTIIKNKLKDESGLYSIEAVLVMPVLIMIILFALACLMLVYPLISARMEMNTLMQSIKIQGGLTESAAISFTTRLNDIGLENINLEVTTESGIPAYPVDPVGVSGNNYISRVTGELIIFKVTFNENSETNKYLGYFGIDPFTDAITLEQAVISERW